MFNNKFTNKDSVVDAVSQIMSEEPEQIDELSKKTLANYMRANTKRMADPKNPDSMERKMKRHDDYFKAADKFHKEDLTFKDYLIDSYKNAQFDLEQIDEKEMTPAQSKKKEEIVLSMKDKEKDFKAKYGKRWKEVMYATATKMAMKEETLEERWDDDDEDDDVRRADAELKRMKAKPIKPHEKTDPDKEISKLAKKTPKEVDESATWTGGHKPDKKHMFSVHIDGEHEGTYHSLDQAKNVVANRKKSTPWRKYDIKQHKRTGAYTHEEVEVNEDKWTDIADGPWKKSKRSKSSAASAAANAAGKGLKKFKDMKKLKKEEVELDEGKDPSRDAGCGSEQPFIQNANTTNSPVMKKIKDVSSKAHSRIRSEMLGKTGTSEEVDPSIKTTDMIRGRVKGGKSDDVGPGANFKSTKIRLSGCAPKE
jgi:hypothetical protein